MTASVYTRSSPGGPELGLPARPPSETWAGFRRNRAAVIGLAIASFLVVLAIAAPVLTRLGVVAEPNRLDLSHANAGVSLRHPLGTDPLGRDLLARAVHGARISLSIAILVEAVVFAIGATVGTVAASAGGWVDNALMRLTDVMHAFPTLLFVLVVASVVGAGYWNVFLAVAAVSWPHMARVVRGQVLAVRASPYVEAAQAAGSHGVTLVRRHVAPNSIGPVIVVVVFGIPSVVFLEAFLSFVSVGMHPPAPSWGVMLADGSRVLFASPLEVAVPAAAVGLATLAFNLIGDGLRDALSPRSGDGAYR